MLRISWSIVRVENKLNHLSSYLSFRNLSRNLFSPLSFHDSTESRLFTAEIKVARQGRTLPIFKVNVWPVAEYLYKLGTDAYKSYQVYFEHGSNRNVCQPKLTYDEPTVLEMISKYDYHLNQPLEYYCSDLMVSPENYILKIESIGSDLHFQEVEVIADPNYADTTTAPDCLYSDLTFPSDIRFSDTNSQAVALKLEHATFVNDPGSSPVWSVVYGRIHRPTASQSIDGFYQRLNSGSESYACSSNVHQNSATETRLFRAGIAAASAGLELEISKVYIWPVSKLLLMRTPEIGYAENHSEKYPHDWLGYYYSPSFTNLKVFIDGPGQNPVLCQPKVEYTAEVMRVMEHQDNTMEEKPLEYICHATINKSLNRVNVESVGKAVIFNEIEVVME